MSYLLTALLTLACGLAACGGGSPSTEVVPETGMSAFPPMSYGYPPGASSAALAPGLASSA